MEDSFSDFMIDSNLVTEKSIGIKIKSFSKEIKSAYSFEDPNADLEVQKELGHLFWGFVAWYVFKLVVQDEKDEKIEYALNKLGHWGLSGIYRYETNDLKMLSFKPESKRLAYLYALAQKANKLPEIEKKGRKTKIYRLASEFGYKSEKFYQLYLKAKKNDYEEWIADEISPYMEKLPRII